MADFVATYSPAAWIGLLSAGVLIGLLGGLLGIGGGVVAVPVLIELFGIMGLESGIGVATAIGTAQASIVIASATAAAAHWRAGTIDAALVRSWLPGLLVGSAVGLWIGSIASPALLTTLFAAIAIGLALKIAAGDRLVIAPAPPGGALGQLPPAVVGALASAVGVGGGTLSTPVLTLFRFPIRRAIGAGALFNLVIALPATAFFLGHDLDRPGRPGDALGDVALICAAALSVPALFVAPIAARWSSRVPVWLLRRLFALCLIVIAARLIWRG
ncbi:MAG: sulfite exporter TauE/SafE family protein [Pseudomonadota bacterium]